MNRIPAAEFYRISLDDSKPIYRIAGGLQDNSNWVGPSAVYSKEGIRNCDWTPFTGADGFYVLFDPAHRKPGVRYLGGNHVFRFTDRAEQLCRHQSRFVA